MHLWCQFKKKTPGPVVEPRWCFWLSPVPIHEKLYGDLDGPETYGCVLQRYPSGRLKVFNEEEFTGDFCHPPPWFNHRVLALGDTPLLLCWAWSCHGIYKQKLKTPPNDKYSLHNTSAVTDTVISAMVFLGLKIDVCSDRLFLHYYYYYYFHYLRLFLISQRWLFSTSFEPIRSWRFTSSHPTIGDHLKVCPFNKDIMKYTQPFKLHMK